MTTLQEMTLVDTQSVFDAKDRFVGALGVGSRKGEIQLVADQNAMLDRAVARHRLKHRAGITRLSIVGDSWAAGNGASTGAKSWAGLTATAQAAQFAVSNYGYSGRPVTNYAWAPRISGTGPADIYTFTPLMDDVFAGIWGLNDLCGVDSNAQSTGGCGPDPTNFPQWQSRVQAVATWLMIPEASRVRAHNAANSGANAAVTYAGGAWNHGGYSNNPGFSFGTNAGDTCQFTTTKGDLLVLRFGAPNTANGAMRIEVDGVTLTEVNKNGGFDAYFLMDCIIIRLDTNAQHVVRLTQVGGGNLMFHSCDCVDSSRDFGGTLLYSPPTRLTLAGWAAGAKANDPTTQAAGVAAWLYGNGGSDRFAQALHEAMSDLYDRGFNVAPIHVRAGFNPNVCTSSGDWLHPNDSGHWHIFNKFSAALSRMTS